MRKLSPRQLAFCTAYAECGNATQAYKMAGYAYKNDNTAGVCAGRMLKNAKIAAKIDEITAKIEDDKIMGVKEMQQRLTEFARMTTTDNDMAALRAIELLGKMQGAFLQRQEIDINGALPVVLHDDVPSGGGSDTS